MNHKKITITQIAKEANVSISTVSRVFNGTALEKVGKEAKERVEAVIRKYNYRPSIHASGLASGKTNLIGVQMLSLARPLSNVEMLNSITESAAQKGYNIILGISDWDAEREIESINVMLEKGIDGLIWQPVNTPNIKIARNIQDKMHSVVWLNRDCEFGIPASCSDEIESGRLAAKYLLSQGCSRPAFVGFLHEYHTSLRLQGWKALLEEKRLGSPSLIHPFSQKHDKNYKLIQKVFSDLLRANKKNEFDGLFVSGSEIAYIANDAMNNMKGKHKNIPVIGHNMLPMYSDKYAMPTISPDNKGIGSKAVEILMNLLEEKTVKNAFLKPSLKGA